MTPRDPARIGRILKILGEAWHLFPDQRLGQLIINTKHDCDPMFYLEDDELELGLQKMIDGRRKFLDDQERKKTGTK